MVTTATNCSRAQSIFKYLAHFSIGYFMLFVLEDFHVLSTFSRQFHPTNIETKKNHCINDEAKSLTTTNFHFSDMTVNWKFEKCVMQMPIIMPFRFSWITVCNQFSWITLKSNTGYCFALFVKMHTITK